MKTIYRYEAINKLGKKEFGAVGADEYKEAVRILRERALRPILVEERGTIFNVQQWFVKRPVDRLAFFRAFAALQEAGSTLGDTFNLLVEQARNSRRGGLMNRLPWVKQRREKFIKSIESLRNEVLSGTKISDAMSRRPDEFSEIESAMCQIGEETGTLPEVLEQTAKFLERDRKFSKQLSDALMYPALVAVFAVFMIVYMVTNMIPQFANLYVGFGVDLPIVMKIMLNIAGVLKSPLFLVFCVCGFGGLIFGLSKFLATAKGALAFDKFRLSIPLLGQLVEKIVVARLCRVLSMLSDAGKGHLQALEIAIPVTESPVYSKAMIQARDLLQKGQVVDVHEALLNTHAFEPILTGFVKVGVKTGNLGTMLSKISEYYEDDIASLTSMIPTFVQTLVTIIMGFIVGVIVYSVYVPLTQLVTQIHQ